jgi:hypothetical protein
LPEASRPKAGQIGLAFPWQFIVLGLLNLRITAFILLV